MRITDHRMVKVWNGILRRAQMQELHSNEAEVIVLYYLERYPQLEREMILPYRNEMRFMPASFMKKLWEATMIITMEVMDLIFTMRGIESVYCIKGRDYHDV